jgi:hypothetical protein
MTASQPKNRGTNRPIDVLRNSAGAMEIGIDGDNSPIVGMVSTGERLYIIKAKAIYAVLLADQIDPERTNPLIPNTQQRILPIGADDRFVAAILLTAEALFKKTYLGQAFDETYALEVSIGLLKDIHALSNMREKLEAAQRAACTSHGNERQSKAQFRLPSINDLKTQWDSFAQTARHVVTDLERLAALFYPNELKAKWVQSLTNLASERYGLDSPFAKFMSLYGHAFLFVIEMRNMVEHPKPEKSITITDFRLLASGELALPSATIVEPDSKPVTQMITALMDRITNDLANGTELLIAHLCNHNIHTLIHLPVQVIELPVEKRRNPHARFSYGFFDGTNMNPIG